MTDVVFQHNTLVRFPGINCNQSMSFESKPGVGMAAEALLYP